MDWTQLEDAASKPRELNPSDSSSMDVGKPLPRTPRDTKTAPKRPPRSPQNETLSEVHPSSSTLQKMLSKEKRRNHELSQTIMDLEDELKRMRRQRSLDSDKRIVHLRDTCVSYDKALSRKENAVTSFCRTMQLALLELKAEGDIGNHQEPGRGDEVRGESSDEHHGYITVAKAE